MNGELILDSLEYIDDALIERAGQAPRRSRLPRIALAAACLCLALGGLFLLLRYLPKPSAPAENGIPGVQQWSETMSAADYFRDNPKQSGPQAEAPEASLVMPPYAAACALDGERAALEAGGVLPPMPEHPSQDFRAEYNGDGSLYKVRFLWMRRGNGLERYSDLSLTAAPAEIRELSDVITVYDTETPVTQTLRDGVLITAEGCEGRDKTLTWQTEGGWYQIGGSWNDSFEDMVALLDWFWAHPFDLARYADPPEEVLRFAERAAYPDAFSNAIPDFAALGYETESERLSLSGDRPVWFEGVYTRGDTRVRWTVDTADTAEAREANVGKPRKFMQVYLEEALKEKDCCSLFLFSDDRPVNAILHLESGSVDDACELIESLAD